MAKSVVDYAIDHIDAQIADLQRAKQILAMAANQSGAQAVEAPKKRGRKRKAGLPAQQNETSADGF